jgi:multiple sugar transport system permease protein
MYRVDIFKSIVIYVLIGLTLVICVFPYFWLIETAFKTRVDAFAVPPVWIFKPTLAHFQEAFLNKGFSLYFMNSLIIAGLSTLIVMVFALPAAYAFSRFKMFASEHLFFYTLVSYMAPPIIFCLPLYLLFSKFHAIDTLQAIILGHTEFNLGYAIWLMRGFFEDVPRELDKAALVDGCTQFEAFYHVILPVAMPGIVVTCLFCFISSWNEFLYALTLTGHTSRTLPVAILGLVTPLGTNWGQIASVSVVITAPVCIITFLLQRYIVRGLTLGAVKG